MLQHRIAARSGLGASAPGIEPGSMTVRTIRGAPRPRASTVIAPRVTPWTDRAEAEANAQRPSAVPTTAVGRPGTDAITGFGAASGPPAAPGRSRS